MILLLAVCLNRGHKALMLLKLGHLPMKTNGRSHAQPTNHHNSTSRMFLLQFPTTTNTEKISLQETTQWLQPS